MSNAAAWAVLIVDHRQWNVSPQPFRSHMARSHEDCLRSCVSSPRDVHATEA